MGSSLLRVPPSAFFSAPGAARDHITRIENRTCTSHVLQATSTTPKTGTCSVPPAQTRTPRAHFGQHCSQASEVVIGCVVAGRRGSWGEPVTSTRAPPPRHRRSAAADVAASDAAPLARRLHPVFTHNGGPAAPHNPAREPGGARLARLARPAALCCPAPPACMPADWVPPCAGPAGARRPRPPAPGLPPAGPVHTSAATASPPPPPPRRPSWLRLGPALARPLPCSTLLACLLPACLPAGGAREAPGRRVRRSGTRGHHRPTAAAPPPPPARHGEPPTPPRRACPPPLSEGRRSHTPPPAVQGGRWLESSTVEHEGRHGYGAQHHHPQQAAPEARARHAKPAGKGAGGRKDRPHARAAPSPPPHTPPPPCRSRLRWRAASLPSGRRLMRSGGRRAPPPRVRLRGAAEARRGCGQCRAFAPDPPPPPPPFPVCCALPAGGRWMDEGNMPRGLPSQAYQPDVQAALAHAAEPAVAVSWGGACGGSSERPAAASSGVHAECWAAQACAHPRPPPLHCRPSLRRSAPPAPRRRAAAGSTGARRARPSCRRGRAAVVHVCVTRSFRPIFALSSLAWGLFASLDLHLPCPACLHLILAFT